MQDETMYVCHIKIYTYLKTITALCFFADNIKYRVDQLSTFCVVALGPVVSSSTLSKDEVVRSEKLSVRSRSDGVHCAGLQIHQDGPRDIFASTSLSVVDVDSLQLEIGITVVGTSWVYAMLIRDHLPEL